MSILTPETQAGLTASKSWPSDVRLYQPFEVEQILMDDFADCLAVKTLLNMLGLPFQIELRLNAHYMSPSGQVPFLRVDSVLVSEFMPIIKFLAAKGYSLSSWLPEHEYTEMQSCMLYAIDKFKNILLYVMWLQDDTYQKMTRKRFGSPFSWPLNRVLPWLKRQQILQHLNFVKLNGKSLEEVYTDFGDCCQVLSTKLGSKKYFFGDKPTELDALTFAYLYSVMTTKLHTNRLENTLHQHSNLVNFCKRIDDEFYKFNGV